MARFLPWLRLRAPDGRCYELNNCQVLGYLQKFRSSDFEVFANCADCCPECVGDINDWNGENNNPIADNAWWATLLGSGSNDAQGFYLEEIYLEGSNSERRQGETGEETQEFTPRRLEITGVLMASSSAALLQITNALSLLFSQIDANSIWEIELLAFCPDSANNNPPQPIYPWTPDPLPALDPVTGDPCVDSNPCFRQDAGFTPQVLSQINGQTTAFDSGVRRLLQVRFVSLDEIDDDGDPGDARVPCDGVRVQIILEILTEQVFGEATSISCPDVASGGHPWDDLPAGSDLTDWRCRPYDWTAPKGAPSGPSCPDDPLTVVPLGLEDTRPLTPFTPPVTATQRPAYCDPMFRQVRACLSPSMPNADDLLVSVEIRTATVDVRNFGVFVYPAFYGWPSPETCEGEAMYNTIRPCRNPWLIPWIPAQSTMSIDGPGRQVRLSCFGAQAERADDRVDSIGGGLQYPTLKGGCFYWVVLKADCFNISSDIETTITFTPVTVGA